MAQFNPNIPREQAEYLHLSRPIEQPNFISTTGKALQETGNILEGAVKGADEVVKAFARTDVQDKVNKEREEYTQGLEAGKAYTNLVQMAGGPQGPGFNNILPQEQPQEPPPDIKRVPQQLNVYNNARASGKISETDFYGRVNALLSDIRSRYPMGYREYIDEQASKILGVNPANAYVRSLIADINSQMTSEQKIRNEAITDARKAAGEGIPHADDEVKKLIAGGDINAFYTWYNQQNAFRYKTAVAEARAKEYEGNTKLQVDTLRDAFQSRNAYTISTSFDYQLQNLPPGTKTDEFGNLQLSPQQREVFIANNVRERENIRGLLLADAKRPQRGGGPSYYELDPEGANRSIKSLLEIYDHRLDMITNDKTGEAGRAARITKSILENDTLKAQTDGTIGWPIRQMEVIRKLAGDVAAQEFYKSANMPGLLKDYASVQNLKLGANSNPANPGTTLKAEFEAAEKAGIKLPEYYDQLADMIVGPRGLLGNGNQEFKEGLIAALGNPKNRGYLANIAPDYKDAQGWHPGNISLYRKLTSSEVVDEVWRVSNLGKHWLWDQYKDTQINAFKTDIFGKEIQALKDIVNSKDMQLNWHEDKDAGIYRWSVDPITRGGPTGRLEQAQSNPRLEQARASMERLNAGMNGMINIVKREGGHPTEAILRMFQDMGVDLTKPNVKDIPGQMIEAIRHEREQQQKTQQKFEGLGNQ